VNRKNPTNFSPIPSWMIWPLSEGGRANVNLKETAPSFNPPMGWGQNLAKLLSENGKKIYLSQFDSMDGQPCYLVSPFEPVVGMKRDLEL
jgi:hypothetical protein